MISRGARRRLYNCDCIKFMRSMPDRSVDFILTDIPYGECHRKDMSFRNLDKGVADLITFSLDDFLPEIYRLIRNSLVIFCSAEQFSGIRATFKGLGTVRTVIWEKTNPMPINARSVYLSGVEHAVWLKKKGAETFNAFCKNTVFRYPVGSSKIHPTEKNHGLLRDLILDNTNPGDLVFDPCAGSAATLLTARKLGRRYLGCELDKEYFARAIQRLEEK